MECKNKSDPENCEFYRVYMENEYHNKQGDPESFEGDNYKFLDK